MNCGMAIAARRPIIATTKSSSIRVKPVLDLRAFDGTLSQVVLQILKINSVYQSFTTNGQLFLGNWGLSDPFKGVHLLDLLHVVAPRPSISAIEGHAVTRAS